MACVDVCVRSVQALIKWDLEQPGFQKNWFSETQRKKPAVFNQDTKKDEGVKGSNGIMINASCMFSGDKKEIQRIRGIICYEIIFVPDTPHQFAAC
jgi:hypothetical protein